MKQATSTQQQPTSRITSQGSSDFNDLNGTDGYKWSLSAFRKWLAEKTSQEIMLKTFDKIHDLCVKTMIAAESEITPKFHAAANYRTNCFELFGCDVILDDKLQPHLLEVNVSPSLMGSSPLDRKIKSILIADTFHIVGIYPHDTKIIEKYGIPPNSSLLSSVAYVESSSKTVGSSNSSKSTTIFNSSHFSFVSSSKLLNSQDNWRRDPQIANVNFQALCNDPDIFWPPLLMIDDELERSKSSHFKCFHPHPNTATRYNNIYRNNRFSDHILGFWVLNKRSCGKLKDFIPKTYMKTRTLHAHSADDMNNYDSSQQMNMSKSSPSLSLLRPISRLTENVANIFVDQSGSGDSSKTKMMGYLAATSRGRLNTRALTPTSLLLTANTEQKTPNIKKRSVSNNGRLITNSSATLNPMIKFDNQKVTFLPFSSHQTSHNTPNSNSNKHQEVSTNIPSMASWLSPSMLKENKSDDAPTIAHHSLTPNSLNTRQRNIVDDLRNTVMNAAALSLPTSTPQSLLASKKLSFEENYNEGKQYKLSYLINSSKNRPKSAGTGRSKLL